MPKFLQYFDIFLNFLVGALMSSLIAALWILVSSFTQFMDEVRDDSIIRVAQQQARILELKEAINQQGYGLISHEANDLEYAHRNWKKRKVGP